MTLFGTTLDPMQVFALVGGLLALVLWGMRLKGQRDYARWFKQWEAGRKERRDAELAAERGEDPAASASPSKEKRGPWG